MGASRRVLGVTSILLLALMFSGCAGSASSNTPAPATDTPVATTAEPAPERADPPVLTRPWTTQDGYTWKKATILIPTIQFVGTNTNTIDQ